MKGSLCRKETGIYQRDNKVFSLSVVSIWESQGSPVTELTTDRRRPAFPYGNNTGLKTSIRNLFNLKGCQTPHVAVSLKSFHFDRQESTPLMLDMLDMLGEMRG